MHRALAQPIGIDGKDPAANVQRAFTGKHSRRFPEQAEPKLILHLIGNRYRYAGLCRKPAVLRRNHRGPHGRNEVPFQRSTYLPSPTRLRTSFIFSAAKPCAVSRPLSRIRINSCGSRRYSSYFLVTGERCSITASAKAFLKSP